MSFITFLILFNGSPDLTLFIGDWQNSKIPELYLIVTDSTLTVINPGYGEVTNKYEVKVKGNKTFIYLTDSATPKKMSIKKLTKNILVTRSILKTLDGEWKRVNY